MSLCFDVYQVRLRLTEDILGTVPKDRKVYTRFIQAKAREQIEKDAKKGIPLTNGEQATEQAVSTLLADEPETIQEVEERGWTSFHSDEKGPFLFDYAIKGFLKEAARTLKEYDPKKGKAADGEEAGDDEDDGDEKKKKSDKGVVKQLQDKFSRYVFVRPRKIYLPVGDNTAELECIERPLRAQTAQGPRVTVVRSDTVKAGAEFGFLLHVLYGGGVTRPIIENVFEYGNYQGLGQWRSGGYGRFELVQLDKLKA